LVQKNFFRKNKNSLYIGYASDLRKRHKEYNSDNNLATKPHIPSKLILGSNTVNGSVLE